MKSGYAFPLGFLLPFLLHPILPPPPLPVYDVPVAVIGGLFVGFLTGLYCYYKAFSDKGDGAGVRTLLLVAGLVLGQTTLFVVVMDTPIVYAFVRCSVIVAMFLSAYHLGVKKRRQKGF